MKKQPLMNHKVKILCLGDSLTCGDGNPSGYRYELFRLLTGADIAFSFIGPCCSADFRMPEEYRHHAGYCGAVIGEAGDGIENSIYARLNDAALRHAVEEAEVVLLMIGTNDVNRNIDLENIGKRYLALLDKLYAINPALVVFASTYWRRRKNPYKNAAVNEFLTSFDADGYHRRYGREFYVLDFNRRGTPAEAKGDYPVDDGHPAEGGNRKIANLWFAGINNRLREMNERGIKDTEEIFPVGMMTDLAPVTLAPGRSKSFSAKALPINLPIGSIAWSSSDEAVCTVDEYGTVTARGVGSCEIKAITLSGGVFRHATVTVEGEPFVASAGRELLFNGVDCNPKHWTGLTEAVKPKFKNILLRYPNYDGELSTKKSYATKESFCLSLDLTHVATTRQGRGNFFAIGVGGVTLQCSSSGELFTLWEEDRVISEKRVATPSRERKHYDIIKEDGMLTVLRDGEVFMRAALEGEGADTPVRIVWEKQYSVTHIHNLTLYK